MKLDRYVNWLASEWWRIWHTHNISHTQKIYTRIYSLSLSLYIYLYLCTYIRTAEASRIPDDSSGITRAPWVGSVFRIAVGDRLGWRRQATRWVPKRFDPGVWQLVCSLAKVGRQARCQDLHESVSKPELLSTSVIIQVQYRYEFPLPFQSHEYIQIPIHLEQP